MGLQARTFDNLDALEPMADAWNALPPARGLHADIFDSHAWFSTWMEAHGPKPGSVLSIPAVIEGDAPRALLPLLRHPSGRFEGAGVGVRPRYRPIIGTEEPDPEAFGLLTDEVARAGAKDLTILNLPSRDPATEALRSALEKSGYRVLIREGKEECIASVADSWDLHRKPLKSVEKNVKRSVNRAKRLGELELETFVPGGRPARDALQTYVDLHPHSWKGAAPESTVIRWQGLMDRTQPLDWPHAYVLKISGIPAAAITFFCVGPVAIGYRNVYDQRMAAISPGSILMWWAHEDLIKRVPLKTIDYLTGRGAQKDHFTQMCPRLLLLEAVKKTVLSPLLFPLRRQLRRLQRARRARQTDQRWQKPEETASAETHTRTVTAEGKAAGYSISPLEIDKTIELYLSVSGRHRGLKQMTDLWSEGDSWWQIGDYQSGELPIALVRLGSDAETPRLVREIILVAGEAETIDGVIESLATGVGSPVTAVLPDEQGEAGIPIPVHEAILPWPEQSKSPA